MVKDTDSLVYWHIECFVLVQLVSYLLASKHITIEMWNNLVRIHVSIFLYTSGFAISCFAAIWVWGFNKIYSLKPSPGKEEASYKISTQ